MSDSEIKIEDFEHRQRILAEVDRYHAVADKIALVLIGIEYIDKSSSQGIIGFDPERASNIWSTVDDIMSARNDDSRVANIVEFAHADLEILDNEVNGYSAP